MHRYEAIPMQPQHIPWVFALRSTPRNKAALHGGDMPLEAWEHRCQQSLAHPNEANFIFCHGSTPVAWLKLEDIHEEVLWISMLVVDERYQRQGVGSHAVRFAERYAVGKGVTKIGIRTTTDNVIAHSCYRKLGYVIVEEGDCTNGDGQIRRGYSFYKDHIDALSARVDGVPFRLKEAHDFSFLHDLGTVLCVFDAQDSGNLCFGVRRDNRRFFVKYAGASTIAYQGETADAVTRLKNAMQAYADLRHPNLVSLVDHYPTNEGYVAVFDWVDGESLRAHWAFSAWEMLHLPQSPNVRFRSLPVATRLDVATKIIEFHQHVHSKGYVAVDFYDGSLIYNFANDTMHICDIDEYHPAPLVNTMGRMWGSSRFMSPEEYLLGADIDQRTTVFVMGAMAFYLLGGTLDRSPEAWQAGEALHKVALQACSPHRNARYSSLAEFAAAWTEALATDGL